MIPPRRTPACRRQSTRSPRPATRPERCISSPSPTASARIGERLLTVLRWDASRANFQATPVDECRGRWAMRYTYTGIEVNDLDRSIAFYRGRLRMQYLGRQSIEQTGG